MKHSPIEIPIYEPSLRGNEKKYTLECLKTNWISSKGDFISEFEKQFSSFIKSDFSTTVCNGTVALHLALLALGIVPGDEIIVPTLTYIASVNAIHYLGAIPVFVDSIASSWQMDPNEIQKKITPRTKAILVVHLYGQACEMDQIVFIAKKNNLLIVEDCAEAIGAYYKQQHVGTFGEISTFSFYGNKTITTGEGGMVVTKHKDLHEKIVQLRGQGLSKNREYWHEIVGYNYRMTNICAAIGLAQLEQIDTFLKKKRKIAKWYEEELFEFTSQVEMKNTIHSYWMYSILSDRRESLRKFLREKGIETRPLFPCIHQMPMYFTNEKFPVAESLSQRGINLPSYPKLTKNHIKKICGSIIQWKKYTFMDAEVTAEALPTFSC